MSRDHEELEGDDLGTPLQQAFSAYRAEKGHIEARNLLIKFGADAKKPSLENVPASRFPALLMALKGEPLVKPVMSAGDVRGALADMHESIYRRWNHGWKRPLR